MRLAPSPSSDSSVSPGSVVLQDATAPDMLRTVSIGELLDQWSVVNASAIVEKHAGWPAKRPCNSAAVQVVQRRAFAMAAMNHMSRQPEFDIGDAVDVYAKPRKVEVRRAFAAGSLVLLPESQGVKSQMAAEFVTQDPWQEVSFVPADGTCRHFWVPSTANDCVAPFWMVSFVDSPEAANLEIAHVVVQMIGGHDYAPLGVVRVGSPAEAGNAEELLAPQKKARKGGGTGKSKPAQSDALPTKSADEPTSWQVKLAVFVNSKDLKPGDVLTVHRKPDKKDKTVQPVNVGSLTKKALLA